MSVERKGQPRREAYLTGIGSILGLSGNARDFKVLHSQNFESDWHALSDDVENVGADIRTVLYQAILELPPEKKRLLAEKIRKALTSSGTSFSDDGPTRSHVTKDMDATRSSKNLE